MPRRRPSVWLLGAALVASVAHTRPAAAADGGVAIACPGLAAERNAELESRVRANLLTTEPNASVLVTCQLEASELRVELAPETITSQLPPSANDAAFRDDVLRALDEALQELARRRAAASHVPEMKAEAEPPLAAPAAEPPPPAVVPIPEAPAAAPPTREPPAPRVDAAAERAWSELGGAALLEFWDDRLALGGELAAARFTPMAPTLGFGLRAGFLRALTNSTSFTATEWHAAAEMALQPAFAAGFRAHFELGLSALFINPEGSLTARGDTASTALFLALHVTRPFRFGHFALLPAAGLRLFSAPRGVRIDANERLKLPLLAAKLGVGLAYYLE